MTHGRASSKREDEKIERHERAKAERWQERRIYCRYCGARLRYDQYGPVCPDHPLGHDRQND
jgi:hypothetical protein